MFSKGQGLLEASVSVYLRPTFSRGWHLLQAGVITGRGLLDVGICYRLTFIRGRCSLEAGVYYGPAFIRGRHLLQADVY